MEDGDSNAIEEGRSGGGSTPAAAPATSSPNKGKKTKKLANHTPMEILHGFVATVSILTSLTGMVLTRGDGVVIFAGALTCVIAPYAYYQQTKLTDINFIKATYMSITRQVDRLNTENRRLHDKLTELTNTIDRLEDVETAMDIITGTQGQSIEEVTEQVQQSAEILAQMKKNLRAYVLQNLLQVVIRSDHDDNMKIEDDEIDDLIRRIRNINGVEVNEEEFRKLVAKSGGSLTKVMDIIRNMMAYDDGDDELGGGSGGNDGDDTHRRSSVFIVKDSTHRDKSSTNIRLSRRSRRK